MYRFSINSQISWYYDEIKGAWTINIHDFDLGDTLQTADINTCPEAGDLFETTLDIMINSLW
jgi:hypothetical protein